jgi:hypothetical protein
VKISGRKNLTQKKQKNLSKQNTGKQKPTKPYINYVEILPE